MANLNKVLLIGRLTRDPETRATGGGTSVVAFGLAVNRTYTRRDSNERRSSTSRPGAARARPSRATCARAARSSSRAA